MTNEQKLLINFPFPGFYETSFDAMIDQEVESIFDTDGSGCAPNIPGDLYFKANYKTVHDSQARFYFEAWCDQFKDTTGIDLKAEYESYTSPKEYNFETDRLFGLIPALSVVALFTASEADNHVELTKAIKDRFTSCSGFISGYSNVIREWLAKPLFTWDHNELGTLLIAVLNIHASESDQERDFNTWDLMESYQCNGYLANDVWSCIPEQLQKFAELQREYGKALDYDLFIETGKAYAEGSSREDAELPPLPCPNTLDLFTA